jgi:hypothetical protein
MGKKFSRQVEQTPRDTSRSFHATSEAKTVIIPPGFALVPLVETSEAVIYSTRVKADTTHARTIQSVLLHSGGRYIVKPKL